MSDREYDVIIIGAGPAGLSAGIHLAQLGVEVLILEASQEIGGLARRIKSLKNYPGFVEISGWRFIERIVEQTKKYNLMINVDEEVMDIKLEPQKLVKTTKNKYVTKAILIATGSGTYGLGLKGESWFGSGIFYCDECCKDFLYGKSVGVIGNPHEVIEEAINLKRFTSEIIVLSHNEAVSFTEDDKEKMMQNGIRVIKNFARGLEGHYGNKRIVLNNGERISVDCVFIAGNLKNIVKLARRIGIKTHRKGCIIVDKYGRTNIEGVFAAGACTSVLKDIVPSCIGDGAKTAAAIRMFLLEKRKE